MDRVAGWVVFYADGREISNVESTPETLPIDGVQWIVEFLDNGNRRHVHGVDFYRWTGDSWAGGSTADLLGWLRQRDRIPIILYGLWVSDAAYDSIRVRARGVSL